MAREHQKEEGTLRAGERETKDRDEETKPDARNSRNRDSDRRGGRVARGEKRAKGGGISKGGGKGGRWGQTETGTL